MICCGRWIVGCWIVGIGPTVLLPTPPWIVTMHTPDHHLQNHCTLTVGYELVRTTVANSLHMTHVFGNEVLNFFFMHSLLNWGFESQTTNNLCRVQP